MTEQASAEAQALADTIWKWPGYAFTDGRVAEAIDALIVQRVAAERERWQERDRQRLEQIERLQETVQSFQSTRDERSENDPLRGISVQHATRLWRTDEQSLLARLGEPDVREAVKTALEQGRPHWITGVGPGGSGLGGMADAAIAVIKGMLK